MLLFVPLPFLAIGCICFLFCTAIPPARKFALPTSLWPAAFGLILTAAVIALALLYVGAAFVKDNLHSRGMGAFAGGLSHVGLLLVIGGLLTVLALTTGVTLLHGAIIRRLTFPLFRIYVAFVSLGVGALAAFPIGFWLTSRMHLSLPVTIFVVLLFLVFVSGTLSYFCFQHAADFRGTRPDNLNPITPEEYATS